MCRSTVLGATAFTAMSTGKNEFYLTMASMMPLTESVLPDMSAEWTTEPCAPKPTDDCSRQERKNRGQAALHKKVWSRASPRSGRVKVAQHFSAGNRSATSPSPCNGRLINPRLGRPCGFSRPFHGLSLVIAPIPPINRWAIFSRRLRRLFGQSRVRPAILQFKSPRSLFIAIPKPFLYSRGN